MGTAACDLLSWPKDNEAKDELTHVEQNKAFDLVYGILRAFEEEGDDLMNLNACFLALYAARERVAGTSKKIIRRRVIRHFAKVAEIIDCSGRGSDRQDSSILAEQATRPGSTLRELSSPSAP